MEEERVALCTCIVGGILSRSKYGRKSGSAEHTDKDRKAKHPDVFNSQVIKVVQYRRTGDRTIQNCLRLFS